MLFDDRLATVLRQRADSEVSQRTQFRQLLDILGKENSAGQSGTDPALSAAAWMRFSALGEEIPAKTRASMIREPGWTLSNPELAAHLADFEPDVASAALNRAQLSEEEWSALIPRLPVRARGFLRLRKELPDSAENLLEQLGVHDRGLPSPETTQAAAPPTKAPKATPPISTTMPSETPEAEKDFVPPPPVRIAGVEPVEHPDDEPAMEKVETPLSPDPTPNAVPIPHADNDALEDVSAVQDASLPKEEPTSAEPNVTGPTPADTKEQSDVSDLVERIEKFKRNRAQKQQFDSHEPRLPLGEEDSRSHRTVEAFGFAADAAGRIEWSDGEVAAMVIGARLVSSSRMGETASQSPLDRAFRLRQPITGAAKSLAGAEAIAGDWIVDAQPRFTHNGNFSGYVGRFRRAVAADHSFGETANREADHIRQLLHELRTPVTAVQGYAEVIQQQLFGAVSHEYRALAAAIAADAAKILAGFEELDNLAKLETGALAVESGTTDLAELSNRICRQLEPVLHPRMAGISLEESAPCFAAISTDCAEALIWRLLATLGGSCSAGEVIDASLTNQSARIALTCGLPAQLLSEGDVFAAEASPATTMINAGLFGAGFALRLARAEARSAGGDLTREGDTVILTLPKAQQDRASPTDQASEKQPSAD